MGTKRYLTWHREQAHENGAKEGPAYYADEGYTLGHIRLHAVRAPIGGDLTVDIRADGVSILTSFYARLTERNTFEDEAEDYPEDPVTIAEGSEITFHVISASSAEDITCTLEVEAIEDD